MFKFFKNRKFMYLATLRAVFFCQIIQLSEWKEMRENLGRRKSIQVLPGFHVPLLVSTHSLDQGGSLQKTGISRIHSKE